MFCTNLTTDTGAPLRWVFSNDTSNVASWETELTQNTATDLAFSKVVIGADVLDSGVYPVSFEVLQDSQIELPSFIGKMLGIRIGRALSAAVCTGSGSGQPYGYMAAANNTVTSSTTTGFTYNDVVDLIHSLDPAYRDDPSTCLSMHDNTYKYLKELADDNGRPILIGVNTGVADAFPRTFQGWKIVIDQNMAPLSAGAGSAVIAFGRFSDYLLRTVRNIEIRTMNELYLKQRAVGFLAWARYGGQYLNSTSLVSLVTAAS